MLCHYPWNHNFKYIQFWLIFRVQVRSYIKSDVLIKSCFHTTKCDRHELGEKHFLSMVATRKWKKMYGEFNAKDTQTGKCQNSSVWLVNESLYFMFLHELTMAILSDLNNAAFIIITIKHDCWRSIMSPSERRIIYDMICKFDDTHNVEFHRIWGVGHGSTSSWRRTGKEKS